MNGLMMNYPLTLKHIFERASQLFPRQEIASRLPDGSMHRYRYADYVKRVHRLGHLLDRLGVKRGDRVGTLCWNSYRHFELFFGIPCFGAVLHTLNLRLSAEQLVYIINHAEDQVIFCDHSLLPVLDAIRDQLTTVRHVVVIEDDGPGEYERMLAESPEFAYTWPDLDENEACATCYTSGTTGNPKGVLYSHRAVFLHSMALCMTDTFGLSERDTLAQFVPMFHANAWGLPYAALLTGAKVVFSGRHLAPRDMATLIEGERATFTAGVPTLWMQLYNYLLTHEHDLSSVRLIPVGGSAMPRQFIENYEKKFGIRVICLWGMTETTPIGTFGIMKHDLEEERRFDYQSRHGMAMPGVDVRIVDGEGQPLPWDGETMGELQVRGPWVISGYFRDEANQVDQPYAPSFMDGWFRTGDVATVDPEGYIQIMDRTKDLVKSGGEWISSVDLENAIMGHPKVAEAAVIAVAHPTWQERPLALVAPHPEYRDTITKEEVLEFLKGKVAKWWLPDDVEFIDAVPKTSVGKFNKKVLREKFKDYVVGM